MIKLTVYNFKGEKVEKVSLPAEIFGHEINADLLHQSYVAAYANSRKVIAHTKDRAERAGSGKKPWRQKGTGRARVGSVRSPIWRKGGIVFGPVKDRNFNKSLPKKMARKALLVALSAKVKDNLMIIIDSMNYSQPKTKEFKKLLDNLKITKSVLFAALTSERNAVLAARNLPKVTNVWVSNMNAFDLLNNRYLLMSKNALDFLIEKKSEVLKKVK